MTRDGRLNPAYRRRAIIIFTILGFFWLSITAAAIASAYMG